jgi:hypothetical protein
MPKQGLAGTSVRRPDLANLPADAAGYKRLSLGSRTNEFCSHKLGDVEAEG